MDEFIQDLRLIPQNAMTFNDPGSPVYICAENLSKGVEKAIKQLHVAAKEAQLAKLSERMAKVYAAGGLDAIPSKTHNDLALHYIQERMGTKSGKELFSTPVQVPGYERAIKRPLDLGLLRRRAAGQQFSSVLEAVRDVRHVYCNCIEFNCSPADIFRKAAIRELAAADKATNANPLLRQLPGALPKSFHGYKQCIAIVEALLNMTESGQGGRVGKHSAFAQSLDFLAPSGLPRYREFVSKPMWLSKVLRNLYEGAYAHKGQAMADLLRVPKNAQEYWQPGRGGADPSVQLAATGLLRDIDRLCTSHLGFPAQGVIDKGEEEYELPTPQRSTSRAKGWVQAGDEAAPVRRRTASAGAAASTPSGPRVPGRKSSHPFTTKLTNTRPSIGEAGKMLHSKCMTVMDKLHSTTISSSMSSATVLAGTVFGKPVDFANTPGYLDVIEQPMDFSTIEAKLANWQYQRLEEWKADVMLVFKNCRTYNSDLVRGADFRHIANTTEKRFTQLLSHAFPYEANQEFYQGPRYTPTRIEPKVPSPARLPAPAARPETTPVSQALPALAPAPATATAGHMGMLGVPAPTAPVPQFSPAMPGMPDMAAAERDTIGALSSFSRRQSFPNHAPREAGTFPTPAPAPAPSPAPVAPSPAPTPATGARIKLSIRPTQDTSAKPATTKPSGPPKASIRLSFGGGKASTPAARTPAPPTPASTPGGSTKLSLRLKSSGNQSGPSFDQLQNPAMMQLFQQFASASGVMAAPAAKIKLKLGAPRRAARLDDDRSRRQRRDDDYDDAEFDDMFGDDDDTWQPSKPRKRGGSGRGRSRGATSAAHAAPEPPVDPDAPPVFRSSNYKKVPEGGVQRFAKSDWADLPSDMANLEWVGKAKAAVRHLKVSKFATPLAHLEMPVAEGQQRMEAWEAAMEAAGVPEEERLKLRWQEIEEGGDTVWRVWDLDHVIWLMDPTNAFTAGIGGTMRRTISAKEAERIRKSAAERARRRRSSGGKKRRRGSSGAGEESDSEEEEARALAAHDLDVVSHFEHPKEVEEAVETAFKVFDGLFQEGLLPGDDPLGAAMRLRIAHMKEMWQVLWIEWVQYALDGQAAQEKTEILQARPVEALKAPLDEGFKNNLVLKKLLKKLKSARLKKDTDPFMTPVEAAFNGLLFESYIQMVKKPMDFPKLEENLLTLDIYRTFEEFIGDLKLIFDNAILYNGNSPDSASRQVVSSAYKLKEIVDSTWEDLCWNPWCEWLASKYNSKIARADARVKEALGLDLQLTVIKLRKRPAKPKTLNTLYSIAEKEAQAEQEAAAAPAAEGGDGDSAGSGSSPSSPESSVFDEESDGGGKRRRIGRRGRLKPDSDDEDASIHEEDEEDEEIDGIELEEEDASDGELYEAASPRRWGRKSSGRTLTVAGGSRLNLSEAELLARAVKHMAEHHQNPASMANLEGLTKTSRTLQQEVIAALSRGVEASDGLPTSRPLQFAGVDSQQQRSERMVMLAALDRALATSEPSGEAAPVPALPTASPVVELTQASDDVMFNRVGVSLHGPARAPAPTSPQQLHVLEGFESESEAEEDVDVCLSLPNQSVPPPQARIPEPAKAVEPDAASLTVAAWQFPLLDLLTPPQCDTSALLFCPGRWKAVGAAHKGVLGAVHLRGPDGQMQVAAVKLHAQASAPMHSSVGPESHPPLALFSMALSLGADAEGETPVGSVAGAAVNFFSSCTSATEGWQKHVEWLGTLLPAVREAQTAPAFAGFGAARSDTPTLSAASLRQFASLLALPFEWVPEVAAYIAISGAGSTTPVLHALTFQDTLSLGIGQQGK